MDIVAVVRLSLGAIILFYVANCWLNQRYWSRARFGWRPREHWPQVFWANIIGGTLVGTYLIASQFLW